MDHRRLDEAYSQERLNRIRYLSSSTAASRALCSQHIPDQCSELYQHRRLLAPRLHNDQSRGDVRAQQTVPLVASNHLEMTTKKSKKTYGAFKPTNSLTKDLFTSSPPHHRHQDESDHSYSRQGSHARREGFHSPKRQKTNTGAPQDVERSSAPRPRTTKQSSRSWATTSSHSLPSDRLDLKEVASRPHSQRRPSDNLVSPNPSFHAIDNMMNPRKSRRSEQNVQDEAALVPSNRDGSVRIPAKETLRPKSPGQSRHATGSPKRPPTRHQNFIDLEDAIEDDEAPRAPVVECNPSKTSDLFRKVTRRRTELQSRRGHAKMPEITLRDQPQDDDDSPDELAQDSAEDSLKLPKHRKGGPRGDGSSSPPGRPSPLDVAEERFNRSSTSQKKVNALLKLLHLSNRAPWEEPSSIEPAGLGGSRAREFIINTGKTHEVLKPKEFDHMIYSQERGRFYILLLTDNDVPNTKFIFLNLVDEVGMKKILQWLTNDQYAYNVREAPGEEIWEAWIRLRNADVAAKTLKTLRHNLKTGYPELLAERGTTKRDTSSRLPGEPRKTVAENDNVDDEIKYESVASDTAQQTFARSLRRKAPPAVPPPPKQRLKDSKEPAWTEALVYPSSGKNRAVVDWADLSRLDDEELLNDNLISFFLLHMQTREKVQEVMKETYFFNTYFYEALTKGKPSKAINHSAVKRWTKNVNIFDYRYLVVPINKDFHWYCAIVCNANKIKRSPSDNHSEEEDVVPSSAPVEPARDDRAANSGDVVVDVEEVQAPQSSTQQRSGEDHAPGDRTSHASNPSTRKLPDAEAGPKSSGKYKRGPGPRKYPLDQPAIVTLDSLGNSHPEVARNLKDYLQAESLEKRGVSIELPVGVTAAGLPLQDNFADCGVYLIAYLQRFLKHPKEFCESALQKQANFWPSGYKTGALRDQCLKVVLREYRLLHKKTLSDNLDGSDLDFDDLVTTASKTDKSIKEIGSRPLLRSDRQTPSKAVERVEATSRPPLAEIATLREALTSVDPTKGESKRSPTSPLSGTGEEKSALQLKTSEHGAAPSNGHSRPMKPHGGKDNSASPQEKQRRSSTRVRSREPSLDLGQPQAVQDGAPRPRSAPQKESPAIVIDDDDNDDEMLMRSIPVDDEANSRPLRSHIQDVQDGMLWKAHYPGGVKGFSAQRDPRSKAARSPYDDEELPFC